MLTPLEKSVLERMLDKPGEPFETLRRQLSLAVVSKRGFSGVGFFTEFALSNDAPVKRDIADMTLGDVGAELPGLEHGAGFILFVVTERLACWRDTLMMRSGQKARMGSSFSARPRLNHCTQATPVDALREFLAQVPGAPGAERWAMSTGARRGT